MAVKGYFQIMQVDNIAGLPSTAQNGQSAWCISEQALFKFNGTVWMPESRLLVKKSAVQINGKNTGATKIYTLEANSFNFYPFALVHRAVNISGVTTGPTASVGSNASSYNNMSSANLLSTLLNTLGVGGGAPQMAASSVPLAGGTDIYTNVSIGAIATNYTFTTDIIGYYDT